jgi:alpha-tubulin suppressor-like RCC1 family protein
VVRSASGATLAGRVVTWQSSAPAVATVTTAGLVTAGRVLAGVAAPVTITATSDLIEGSAALTVRPVPVWSVSVDPLAAFDGTLDFGESVALGATMRDDAGSVLTGRAVDWSVGSGPVTVSAGGVVLAGEVTAAAPELANVRATSEGVESYEALYVAQLPVATVTVTPNTSSYFVYAEQQLTATSRSAGGTALTGRGVAWTTSDTTRAVIFSEGVLLALGRGAVTLSATVEGQVGSVSITVSGWERIATGAYHTCAVASSGPTYCWGAGAQGGLGNGTTTPASRPSPVDGAAQFSQLTGGDSSTCGIRSFIVDCWGRNDLGQIGDSTVTDRLVPTGQRSSAYQSELPVQIDAGEAHGCLLTDVGALYCWGDNTFGELGDGTTTGRLVPTTVPALSVIYSQVSAGSYHTCGVTTLSRIHCWGANGAGQLGDASFTNRRLPVLVQSAVPFTQVSAGNGHSCAISTSGGAYCWGQNISGELGDGGTTSRSTVAPVSGGLLFTSVRTGSGHTCALTSAGAVYCWGDNTYGQLGDGTFTSRSAPVPVRDNGGSGLVFVTLDVGANFTCGITTRAVLYCWGENSAGQLGNQFAGAAMSAPTPVLPPL